MARQTTMLPVMWDASEMWDQVKGQMRRRKKTKPIVIPFIARPRVVTASNSWQFNSGHRR